MLSKVRFHGLFIYVLPVVVALFILPNSYYSYSLSFTHAYKIDPNGQLAELQATMSDPYGGIPRELAPAIASLIPIPAQIYRYNICSQIKTDTGAISYPETKITTLTESEGEDTRLLIPNAEFCVPSETFKTYYITGKIIKNEEAIRGEIEKLGGDKIFEVHSEIIFKRVPLYWPIIIYAFITFTIALLWWPFLLLWANIDPDRASLLSRENINSHVRRLKRKLNFPS